MTCWRRLRAWQDAALWDRIHRHMLDRLNLADQINWSRASVDASSVAAKKGAIRSDRIRQMEASRAPSVTSSWIGKAYLFALTLTGANCHDSKALTDVVDAIYPIRQKRGRPRKRPAKPLHFAGARATVHWPMGSSASSSTGSGFCGSCAGLPSRHQTSEK